MRFREIEHRVRPSLRRGGAAGVLALAALVVGHELNRDHPHLDGPRIASYGCAAGVLVFGIIATRYAARALGLLADTDTVTRATAPLRLIVQIVGYLLTVIAVLAVLNVDLSQFLVGGALTGVVLGIAAQQALGNFFAGLVLLLARPYRVADEVTVYSGAVNGPHGGTIADIGLLYTSLQVKHGLMKIPNSVLLGAAVGPPVPVVDDPAPLVEPDPDPGPA